MHEVATSTKDASVAYVSDDAGGLRVIDVESGKIVETAKHMDDGGNDFWGVEAFVRDGTTYVLGSDRDSGLWIFRVNG